MKSTLSILVAASTLAMLTACGGSSSDDGVQVIPPGSSVLAITSTNQSSVARVGINSALSVSMAEGALGSGGSISAAAATRAHAMSAIVRHALESASRKAVASAGTHPAAVNSSTDNCAAGGTVTESLDDKDGNQQVTAGDVITTTFAQCRLSATDIIDGAVVITVTTTPVVTATSSQFAASAQFQALAVSADSASYTISGLAAVAESDDDTTSLTHDTVTVGAGGLQVAVASTAWNDTLKLGQGLVVTTVAGYDASTASVTVAGTLSSNALGGQVTIATPVALAGAGTDAYPSSGQMIITGATGSTLRVTVLDDTQVKLELDADGNGSYETTSTVAWTALVP